MTLPTCCGRCVGVGWNKNSAPWWTIKPRYLSRSGSGEIDSKIRRKPTRKCRVLLLRFVHHMLRQALTVNLACRKQGFPVGRLVATNTSVESSWSPILISVGFNLNIGQLDELEQVIVCAMFCLAIDFSSRKFLSIARPSHTVSRWKVRSKMRWSVPVPSRRFVRPSAHTKRTEMQTQAPHHISTKHETLPHTHKHTRVFNSK